MRYLIISLCLIWVGCASYPKKQGLTQIPNATNIITNPYFSNTDTDYVYKANIAVYDKNFGGLFIIKKTQANEHRVVFTTEMGKTLLDFSFINEEFKVNYIIDDLNKNMLINILKSDFKVLITENFKINKAFKIQDSLIFESVLNNKPHYLFKKNELSKITRASKTKEKVVFTFSEISNSFANNIVIDHKNIKLNITLKSITQ